MSLAVSKFLREGRLREKGLFWLLVREGTAQQGGEGVAAGVSQEGLFLIPLDLCLSHVPRGKPETLGV